MDLIGVLFTLIIFALVFSVAWWVIGQLGLPDPFRKVVIVLFGLLAIMVLLNMVGAVGDPLYRRWRR